MGNFKLPASHFLHIHVDLIGPLPTSAGFMYCLTAVDHFTRWPEIIPITYITANTVAHALLNGWISRFGCPQTITTDQGRQLESQLFHALAKLCGIHLSRTTAHHPASNRLVERFHQTLKTAIMCHADEKWTEALPIVLLGIPAAFKERPTGISCRACTQTATSNPQRNAVSDHRHCGATATHPPTTT
jgi:cleavage and polyadenylation specificity factor subunit 1